MKGQMISIDSLIAMTIFTVLISFVLFFGNTIDYRASNIEDLRFAREKLVDVSDQLITTSGDPIFWQIDGTAIKSFGLAYDDHKLSSTKLLRFQNESDRDYNNFRRLLNIGRYDSYIELLNLTETGNCTITANNINFNLTAGEFPSGSDVLSITRIIKMDDSRFCKLRIWVWK